MKLQLVFMKTEWKILGKGSFKVKKQFRLWRELLKDIELHDIEGFFDSAPTKTRFRSFKKKHGIEESSSPNLKIGKSNQWRRTMSKDESRKSKSNVRIKRGMECVNANAAGIDIASGEHWVCAPGTKQGTKVKRFGSYTSDLHEISTWLKEHGVSSVAMESTGIYWLPLYQRLEQDGFEVCLVNARHVKNVAGRTKTDKHDCEWLQKLHSFGLLSPSFRPSQEVCCLRSYLRHRENLIKMSSQQVQLMQKSLRYMNVLLEKVLTDITGKTGLLIIESILAGERDSKKLAEYKCGRVKKSESEIAKALEGDYLPEHLFSLQQALDAYKFFHGQIDVCDQQIRKLLEGWNKINEGQVTLSPAKRKTPIGNEPKYDSRADLARMTGVDLTQVPGFQASTVHILLSEVGLDMSKWASGKHFCSWLGVCPSPEISGGKTLKSKTKRVQSRAAKALRMSAFAATKSNTSIGAFYRRMRARMDGCKAITATAHKLALIFYEMMKKKEPYRELGADNYLKNHQQRVLRNLQRKAKALGCQVIPIDV